MIKDEVLTILWENADRYVSGAALAERLQVSRTAVWKAVRQLRAEGYELESVTRRGYRLSSANDPLSEAGIRRFLRHQELEIRVFPSLGSTNSVLKGLAAEGAPAGLVLIAGEQTEGRGRMGRSFYSPSGSGVYMSLLLRPEIPAAEAVSITTCAAAAVAEALEELSGRPAQIKWVNDVLMDGKKVCGILTEASLDCESGRMNYAVLGIGINARLPAGSFPEALRGVAGSVFDAQQPALRCRIAAAVLDRFLDYYADLQARPFFDAYKRRSMILGRPIHILFPGREPIPAAAEDLGDDFSLVVRYEDGSLHRLSSGEVSVRSG